VLHNAGLHSVPSTVRNLRLSNHIHALFVQTHQAGLEAEGSQECDDAVHISVEHRLSGRAALFSLFSLFSLIFSFVFLLGGGIDLMPKWFIAVSEVGAIKKH